MVALIALAAATSELVTAWTFPLFAAGLAAVGRLVLVLARPRPVRAAVAALLLTRRAGRPGRGDHRVRRPAAARQAGRLPGLGRAAHSERAAAVAKADGWPALPHRSGPRPDHRQRSDAGGRPGRPVLQQPHPGCVTRTLAALGAGWTSNGRSVQCLDNPVTDAIFSVGARVRTGPGAAPGGDPGRPDAAAGDRTAAGGRAALRLEPVPQPGEAARLAGLRLPRRGSCPVGSEVFLWAPNYTGRARLGDSPWVTLRGGQPKRRAALTSLGTVNSPGQKVGYSKDPAPHDPRLSGPGEADRRRGPAEDDGRGLGRGHRQRCTGRAPPGTEGTAVLAAPRIAGWSCNGKPAGSYLGLVAVPLDGSSTTVDCSFRPPGLKAGSAMGAAGLLGLVVLALLPRLLKRSRRTPGTPETTGITSNSQLQQAH